MAALGGLIAVVPLVGAQSSAPDDSPHLLLVPDTPRAEAALDASSARTVARYDAFTLVEARGEDDADLRAAGADRRDDMRRVSLPAGDVDPLRAGESLARKGVSDPDEVLAVVQFTGPVKDTWLERLRDAGVRIVQYVPQNGYLVHATGRQVDLLAALVGTDPAVRAVTRVTGQDKQSERLPEVSGPRLVAVQTLAGADGRSARRSVAGDGARARGDSSIGGLTTQFVSLSSAEIDANAADPTVVAITPYSLPELLDERSAQIVAGNFTAAGDPAGPGGYLTWLEGQGFTGPLGVTVDVTDEGLDTGSAAAPGHSDFRVNGAGASRIAYARDFTDDPAANDCGGHGTNVASIAAGFGVSGVQRQDDAGFLYGMGAAPRATIGASKIFDCDGTFGLSSSFTALASAAYADGARISNNSWGNVDFGRYSPDSREFDFLVRDAQPGGTNQQMVEVFAAGNDGDGNAGVGNEGWATVASPGTAKNVITVGASESDRPLGVNSCGVDDGGADRPGDIINFSSRGPTDDGRLKPDLVAPGTRVVGAAPQTGVLYEGYGVCMKSFPAGNPFYSLQSGTSQAAPAVSGAAALIWDWYADEQGAPPSPAMTKAILISSATDLAGGDTGKGDTIASAPNADQGWGRAHLGGALDDIARDYVDQSEELTSSGSRFARSYAVDTDAPVKVTLAWTDAPGAVDSDPALVNNLDLVVRQGGQTYRGNVLAGGRSIPGGDADIRNNVESVVLPQASGRFSVEVLGTTIAGNGVPGDGDGTDQDFALVVENANPQAAPVLAPEQVTITDSGGDGFLEPGESFGLGVGLRNGGDSAATGVTGSISGAPPLSFTTDDAGWGDIAPGALGTATPPFAGSMAADAACGTTLTANLDLSTEPGTPTPVTIPTGEPGEPQTLSGQMTPLAIPDESSIGVTSTIAISTPGRVKDLDVTIASLTHGWVGDLVIDLTSPEGTTVRLVQHPGGPDNGGHNLLGTTFDDEAPTNISLAAAPYSGSFKPQNDQLSRFDGEQRQGIWRLRVRDLFEGIAGTLNSWQTTTRRAICDFTDQGAPDTSITAGPSGFSTSRSALFSFASSEPGSDFDCSVDGGPFTMCESPFVVGGLAEGTHSFRVQARDAADNVDASAAVHSWAVDTTPPAVSLSRPSSGASLTDPRPELAGQGGLAPGDPGNVTVRLWRGASTAGAPAQTLTAQRDSATGAWSTRPAALSAGTWTARAEQIDAAGNTGSSAAVTFSIGTAPAPDFAIVPREADLADARSGRLTVLAGCGSACRISADLRSRGRRSQVLGRVRASVAAGRSKALRVKLTRKGRTALRRGLNYRATLRVTVDPTGAPLRLQQTLGLRKVNLARAARPGLPYAGWCAEPCSIAASLLMTARDARRHGLRAPGGKPVAVAAGGAKQSARDSRFVLRLRKSARKPLLRARRVKMTLEAKVSGAAGPSHRTTQRLTIRR